MNKNPAETNLMIFRCFRLIVLCLLLFLFDLFFADVRALIFGSEVQLTFVVVIRTQFC